MLYFSPCLPTIITEPGEYQTRSGETVTVETVGASIVHRDCAGFYGGNGSPVIREHWNRTGRIFTGRETDNDIIKRI